MWGAGVKLARIPGGCQKPKKEKGLESQQHNGLQFCCPAGGLRYDEPDSSSSDRNLPVHKRCRRCLPGQ